MGKYNSCAHLTKKDPSNKLSTTYYKSLFLHFSELHLHSIFLPSTEPTI